MKKMIIIILLITLFVTPAFSPNSNVMNVPESEAIRPFDKLIWAVGKVETDFDTLAYNPIEEAAGYFQIRPIRVEHYNKLTGEKMTLVDMFDYYKAEKVFLYFADQIGPYDLERVAKSWNGSGRKTIDYWNKIKPLL